MLVLKDTTIVEPKFWFMQSPAFLLREAHNKFRAIEYSRKSSLPNDDSFKQIFMDHKALIGHLDKKLKNERIEKPMFEDNTLADILDYCLSRFGFLTKKSQFDSTIYSPFQILGRVNQFTEMIRQNNGRKVEFSKNGRVQYRGKINGFCFVDYLEGINMRRLGLNLLDRTEGLLKNTEPIYIHSKLFYSPGVDFDINLALSGTYKGRTATGTELEFKLI